MSDSRLNALLDRTKEVEHQTQQLAEQLGQLTNGKNLPEETDEPEILQALKTENDKLRYRLNILKTATEKEMASFNGPEVKLEMKSDSDSHVCDDRASMSSDKNKQIIENDTSKVLTGSETSSYQEIGLSCQDIQETQSSKISDSFSNTSNENVNEIKSTRYQKSSPSESNDASLCNGLGIHSSPSKETKSTGQLPNLTQTKETNSSNNQESNFSSHQDTICSTSKDSNSSNCQKPESSNKEIDDSNNKETNSSSSDKLIDKPVNDEVSSSSGPCFLCFQPTSQQCPHCPAWSCPTHYPSHRPSSSCLPFAVRYREEVGRYAVATRDIQAMEIVLEDMPAVQGPNYETEAVCMECIGRVDGSILCHHCNFPLCSEACRDGPNHKVECDVFSKLDKKVNIAAYGQGTISHEYGCITVLRLLSIRDTDPDTWQRLGYLMDHDKERREEVDYWRMFQKNVVDFLRVICGLGDVYSDEEVQRAVGLLRTNAAHLELPNMTDSHTSGKVMYPTFSFLSHSCLCNATYSVMPKDAKLVLKAQRDIKCGEEITIQYISFLHGNIQRRKDIRSCWFFTCTCPRCEDPTELGTGLCDSLCQSCGGNLQPKSNDLDTDTWICRSCGVAVPSSSVEAMVKKCEDELWNTLETDVEAYERMLKEYSTKFSANHCQILMIKKNLARALNQQPQGMDKAQAERIVAMWEHFISVYGVVDPGFTKWRAIMLYDLVKIRLVLTDRAYGAKEIAKDEFINRINVNIEALEYVVKALAIEPQESKEGKILILAKKMLMSAKECIRFSSWL